MQNAVKAIVFIMFIGLFVAFITPAYSQGSPRTPLDDHRVLLIGDSQVAGAFGRALMFELTSRGVTYYARAGEEGWGVPRWWQNRWSAQRLIRRNKPTLLLVELGGNDHHLAWRPDYSNQVKRFWNYLNYAMENVHENSDIQWRVLWISPATVVGPAEDLQDKRDRVARKIKNVVGKRNYVESRDVTGHFGRTSDGIHFTMAGGQDWARQIRPRIEDCLR